MEYGGTLTQPILYQAERMPWKSILNIIVTDNMIKKKLLLQMKYMDDNRRVPNLLHWALPSSFSIALHSILTTVLLYLLCYSAVTECKV